MPNANDLRKTLTDPKPLYFAAGVLDVIREEAPERIAAVRATDPKDVQARVSKQAKETQVKLTETLGGIDTDIKKWREQAQHFALQGVGVAAEYAVKAREAYDELADRGRGAVKNWRGEGEAPQVTVEREPVKVAEPPAQPAGAQAGTSTKTQGPAAVKPTPGMATSTPTATASGTATGPAAAKKTGTARKTTTAKSTTAKPTAQKPSTQKPSGAKKTPKSDS